MAATSERLGMADEEQDVEVDAATMMQTLGVLVHRAGGRVVITHAEVAAFHAGGPYEMIADTNPENGNAVLTLRKLEQEEEG